MGIKLKWVRILLAGDEGHQLNFLREISVDGKRLCLVRYEGDYFVTQLKCPHAGGRLANGWCSEGKLICPVHRYSYDLKSGLGSPGQGDYIDTYPVERRSDGLYLGIPDRISIFKKLFRL